ncbi:hypothetical protein AGMMS49991_08270 [Spirochaetia bacterium]|nr:hypothetical protein AGMMS49991_08270 [Spirochaetia bacterium]
MKTSRIKYSKANVHFSQLVKNIDSVKHQNIRYDNPKEKRLKHLILLHGETEKEYGSENIFIETEELYKFFSSTQINKRSDIAQQVYHSLRNRKYIEVPINNPDQSIPFRIYAFRLFAPINMIPTSLAVCISCTQTFETAFGLNYITFTDRDSSQEIILHKESIQSLENGYVMIKNNMVKDEYNKKIYEYYRVIINLIFYMNAHPENVLNGVPQRAVVDENIAASDKKITISKNIELFNRHETSPHLRRGHWRTFTSDYFTNKKGETKWIDPMFIKGEAFTVIEGSNEDKSRI